MKIYSKILFILIILFLHSCSKDDKKIQNIIEGENIELQMIDAYSKGLKALEQGDVLFAAKKFSEAELLYPQSTWAPRASLMSAYSHWSQQYYNDCIIELKRFIKIYSYSKNLDYAYYLLGISYYDSIVDEKTDLKPLLQAKKYFLILEEKFPETDYSLDAKYKLELINDILAAKELYLARHYIKKQKWVAAINRLKNIVTNYETTIFIEEALHRLVEVHYIIGLENEAQKYAKTLGYNYKTGRWYKETYRVFNKDYKQIIEIKKKSKPKILIEKIKSLF